MNSDITQNNLSIDLLVDEERFLTELGEKPDDTDISSQDDLKLEILPVDSEANLIPHTTPNDYDYKGTSTAKDNSEFRKVPHYIAETENLLIAEVTQTNAVDGAVILEVTSTEDQNDGSSDNGLSLRDAVMIAYSDPNQHYQIVLQSAETYSLNITGSDFEAKQGDLNIQGSKIDFVTEGGEENATIDASQLGDRAFYIRGGATVNLSNITITDGSSLSGTGNNNGGNFLVSGGSQVKITDSVIKNGIGVDGGGLYIRDSDVVLENTTVRGNSATSGGGIGLEKTSINTNLSLEIIQSQILENQATSTRGGGIFNEAGFLKIDSSKIAGNTAVDGGAGIYSEGEFNNLSTDPARLDISNSEFIGNRVDGGKNGGGAIWSKSTYINIDRSEFNENVVTGNGVIRGGAIQSEVNTILTITGSSFSGNKALSDRNDASGGAILTVNSQFSVRDSSFKDNSVQGLGGALSLESGNRTYENTIENTEISNNTSTKDAGGMSIAGSTTIRDSLIENNSAVEEGGGFAASGETKWERVTIRNNILEGSPNLNLGIGGGGRFTQGNHNLTDVTFDGNKARFGGNLAAENNAEVNVKNSTFTKGIAEVLGGGLLVNDFATLNLIGSEISENKAFNLGGAGGGLTVTEGGRAKIRESTFLNNKGSDGGDIAVIDNDNVGQVQITDSQFFDSEGILGGSLFVARESIVHIDRSFFSGQSAQEGGIINAAPGAKIDISNSTLTKGQSTDEGSAIYIAPGIISSLAAEVYVTNSTIVENTANTDLVGEFGEAAIFITEGIEPEFRGKLFLYNSVVANNQNNPGEVNPNIVGSDISGQVFEARNNLIEDPTGHNVTNGVDGNIVGVDPLLGNLADNGGDTPTYAPLAGSPVIDAGDNIFVSSDTDQRGEGFLRIVNGTVDIGAVEVQDVQQGDLYLRSIAGDDPLTGGADRDIL